MKTNEVMVEVLRYQRNLLNDLVSHMEMRGVLTVEDYSYCESCADEVSKKLTDIRRFSLDKMIQGSPWFQPASF